MSRNTGRCKSATVCYNNTMTQKGYIQVYTGDGKGKTTAAIGLAIRAAGRGKKSFIAQFMKKGDYGELIAIREFLADLIHINQFGTPDFHFTGDSVSDRERSVALEGIEAVNAAMKSGQYDILILDEINVLLYFKIVDTSRVVKIIDDKPDHIELILTGRNAPAEILDRADLITEMKNVKHYFDQNVLARSGIEK